MQSAMKHAALIVFALAYSSPALSQNHGTHGGHHGHGGPQARPYAGQQTRAVASMADEEVHGHIEGRGLGYARPAELNGYPGPMHVLELKSELTLTAEQIAATEAIFNRMQERAREAGRRYIEAETELDAAFRSGKAQTGQIAELVRAADARRAEKRLAHLEAHIEMAKVLSQSQRTRYAELRGYGAPRSK